MPLDVIDVCATSKILSSKGGKKKNDSVIEIAGSRYYKIHPDSSTRFPTRLVTYNGVYSYSKGSVEANSRLLVNAGFVAHENCIPYLAASQASAKSKADAELRKVDRLQIVVPGRDENKKNEESNKDMLHAEAGRIEEIRRSLFAELKNKETRIKSLAEISKLFKTANSASLRDMSQGVYEVQAAKKQATRYGDSYKLLLNVEGENNVVWGNTYINQTIDSLPSELVQEITSKGFLFVCNKPLAKLTVTGRGRNHHGHVIVYCTFDIYQNAQETKVEKGIILGGETDSLMDKVAAMQILEYKDLLPYREYANLVTFPVGSTHKISALGMATSYGGTARLVVKIGELFYQAGEDLEEKLSTLQPDCIVKIEKGRASHSRRAKYAICSVYEAGDWTAFVDYARTPIFAKHDGSTFVVDVKSINVKGTKRKLLLTDEGDVYKLKKSKLEDAIKPGYL